MGTQHGCLSDNKAEDTVCKGKVIWHLFVWSPGAHREKKIETTVAAELHERFWKSVFVAAVIIPCVLTNSPQWLIETIWNLLESIAPEKRGVFVLIAISLNLSTFLFPQLTPGRAWLLFSFLWAKTQQETPSTRKTALWMTQSPQGREGRITEQSLTLQSGVRGDRKQQEMGQGILQWGSAS